MTTTWEHDMTANLAVRARTGGPDRGVVTMDGLLVAVKILDARRNFGRVDVLVTPLAGSGERWIDVERVHPLPATREEQGR